MISVIIPAYEKEDRVYNCLRSVCDQEYADLEILIVYRPGNDKTRDEIKRIQDPRIRIIEQTKKTGPGGARNIGIRESRGEYLGFVDCDDFIPPDFYRLLYDAIVANKADIAFGEMVAPRARGWKTLSQHNKDTCLSNFFDKYSRIKNGAAFDKLYRTDLIKQAGLYFQEGIFYEDNCWILSVFYHLKKLILVKGAVYQYTLSEKNADQKAALARDLLPAIDSMLLFCKAKAFDSRECRLVKKKILTTFAGGFINNVEDAKKFISILGMNFYIPYILAKNITRKMLFS